MEKLIIPTKLTDPILKWASKSKNRKKYCHKPPSHKGPVVGVGHLNSPSSPLYKEMMEVDKFILNKFGFELDTPVDIKDGFIMSYSEEGHKVHLHKDKNPNEETIHIRFNVMISKPNKGGYAVINDQTIKVEENEVWVCEAGNHYHTIDEVGGTKPRIMLSFGHYIKKELYLKKELLWALEL